MPLRFLSREIVAQSQNNEDKMVAMQKRNLEIQKNITDKFLRTFRRLNFHVEGLKVDSFPYEYSEYMEMSYDHIDHNFSNNLFKEVYSSIYEAYPSHFESKKL